MGSFCLVCTNASTNALISSKNKTQNTMKQTDREEQCDSIASSDLTNFDVESNYSNDSANLLCEQYACKLPMKDESQTKFRLTSMNQKSYKQSALYVPLTFKERFSSFTKCIKSTWAKVPSCMPNRYVRITFIFALLISLAVWVFYMDVHVH